MILFVELILIIPLKRRGRIEQITDYFDNIEDFRRSYLKSEKLF